MFGALIFGIKFVRHAAFITYLCLTYLITTFKILVTEYRPICQIPEFSYSLISVSASVPKIPYWSGPTFDCCVCWLTMPAIMLPTSTDQVRTVHSCVISLKPQTQKYADQTKTSGSNMKALMPV